MWHTTTKESLLNEMFRKYSHLFKRIFFFFCWPRQCNILKHIFLSIHFFRVTWKKKKKVGKTQLHGKISIYTGWKHIHFGFTSIVIFKWVQRRDRGYRGIGIYDPYAQKAYISTVASFIQRYLFFKMSG